MSFSKFDAARLYKKLRALEPNVSGALGTPPSGSAVGAVGDVVLVTGAGTTTDVLDARITNTTFMEIAPADLYGSAEKGAGNIFWSSPADGIMRITHTASTKTRTFKYLLMFALALLLASAAAGQVIQDDGTPLEVQPALNFTTGIACANGANSTDCEVDPASGYMKEGDWATGATYGLGFPYVDFAEVAVSARCVDWNDDTNCEVYNPTPTSFAIDVDGDTAGCAGPEPNGCGPEVFAQLGVTFFIDVNEDNSAEFSTTSTVAILFGGGSSALSIQASGAELIGHNSLSRMGEGMGVGNGLSNSGNSASVGNSSCVGRESATDRLFGDRNCNFGTVNTRETNTAGVERYAENDNELLRLTADYDNATTTGTEITGLQVSVNGARTYDVTYYLLTQSTSASFATTGIEFGVNYTNGTPAPFICKREVPTTSVPNAAATGIEDDVLVGGTTGQLDEYWVTQTEQTTAPDLGPTGGFTTQTASVLETIHCIMVTAAGAGDIELWAAASAANNVRVKAGSWVNVITVQ